MNAIDWLDVKINGKFEYVMTGCSKWEVFSKVDFKGDSLCISPIANTCREQVSTGVFKLATVLSVVKGCIKDKVDVKSKLLKERKNIIEVKIKDIYNVK